MSPVSSLRDDDEVLPIARILTIALITSALPAGMTTSAAASTQSFVGSSATTRSAHTWTVPDGVDRVSVTVVGGAGADGASSGAGASRGSGGTGAGVVATLNVLPGDVIHIGLGANGSGATGGLSGESGNAQWSYGSGGNGAGTVNGGGGGGSSVVEVRRGSDITPALLAGGGGGGGGAESLDGTSASGGAGGLGGNSGFAALPTPASGGDGNKQATGGGAGSGNAGGTAGTHGGFVGSMWSGGAAGQATFGSTGGGGGGAGYYGGGGGGGSSQFVPGEEGYAAGGGGAGASWLSDGAATPLYPLWTSANELVGTVAGSQASARIDYITFSTTSLPDARAGQAYSQTVEAVFGSSSTPDTWSVTPALPAGLTLNASTGRISGTPTGAQSTGTYTVTASRSSVYGLQARSSITLTLDVIDVPGAPTIGMATAGDGSASVAFTAPTSTGGSAITGYTVTSSPGGITASGAASPITVNGLQNGTAYTFTVTATNSAGPGPASGASSSVTPRASGGGGGGGESTAGSESTTSPMPASAQDAPSSSPTSATTAPATTVVTTVSAKKAATIPGLALPRRIAVPGTTVLVPRTLFTSEGTRVKARATIVRWMTRRAPDPQDSALGARIVRNKNGRVSVITTGKRPIVVTLVLIAPATATAEAYRSVTRWRVR